MPGSRSSAFSSEANASVPSGSRVQSNGFLPTRSRASTSRSRPASQSAIVNMPSSARDERRPGLLVQVRDHRRVAGAADLVAGQLRPKLAEVVELTVEDGDHVAGLVRDRLAAGGEIDHLRAGGVRARNDRTRRPSPRRARGGRARRSSARRAPGRARPTERAVRRSRTSTVQPRGICGRADRLCRRLLPRRAAARRRGLDGLRRPPGATPRRARDRRARAPSRPRRGRERVALARPRAHRGRERPVRSAHALGRPRAGAPDRRRPGGARAGAGRLAPRARTAPAALRRRRLVHGRGCGGRAGRARPRRLHCHRLPTVVPGAGGASARTGRAGSASPRRGRAARAPGHPFARHGRARGAPPPA